MTTNPARESMMLNSKERTKALKNTIEFLEKNPSAYSYMQGRVPTGEHSCGCALAWLGYFSGMPTGTTFTTVASRFGVSPDVADEIARKEGYYDNHPYAQDPNLPPWHFAEKAIDWLKTLI